MLEPPTQEVLIRALHQAGGREICGFLLGDAAGRQEFFAARNWAGGPGSFAVSAGEARRVQRYARQKGMCIQAFIHSHREGLELSETDRTGLAASGLPWIVVTRRGSALAYRVHPTTSAEGRSGTGAS